MSTDNSFFHHKGVKVAKGDEVVTVGGVLGRISKIGESYLSIETGNNVELQIQRSAVVQILPKGTLK